MRGRPYDWASMSRPFGVALLVAGWDEDAGYQLYHTDPSGTFVQYQAKAIGSGSEGAQTSLQAGPLTRALVFPFSALLFRRLSLIVAGCPGTLEPAEVIPLLTQRSPA